MMMRLVLNLALYDATFMDKRRLVGLLGWLVDTLQKGILSLFDVKNKI